MSLQTMTFKIRSGDLIFLMFFERSLRGFNAYVDIVTGFIAKLSNPSNVR
jgi:hypothetical protein